MNKTRTRREDLQIRIASSARKYYQDLQLAYIQQLNAQLKTGKANGLKGTQLRLHLKKAQHIKEPSGAEERLFQELLNKLEREVEKMEQWKKQQCSGPS